MSCRLMSTSRSLTTVHKKKKEKKKRKFIDMPAWNWIELDWWTCQVSSVIRRMKKRSVSWLIIHWRCLSSLLFNIIDRFMFESKANVYWSNRFHIFLHHFNASIIMKHLHYTWIEMRGKWRPNKGQLYTYICVPVDIQWEIFV